MFTAQDLLFVEDGVSPGLLRAGEPPRARVRREPDDAVVPATARREVSLVRRLLGPALS